MHIPIHLTHNRFQSHISDPKNKGVFYFYAPSSLVLLSHAHLLNCCSLFPSSLSATLTNGQTGRLPLVKALTVNSDEWGQSDCVRWWRS